MLCVPFWLHLALITATTRTASEMDERTWRCVIHLNTTSEIINNLLTRPLPKWNQLVLESNLTFATNVMKIPFKCSCHVYMNENNKQHWNTRPLAAAVSAGTWQSAFHTCSRCKGTSVVLQDHHHQATVPWQTGCWQRCRPLCFLWRGQSVCLGVSWTRASVCSRSGHCIQTWRGSAA